MADAFRYPSLPPLTLAVDMSSSDYTLKTTTDTDSNGVTLTTAYFNTSYITATLINDSRTLWEFILIDATTIANLTTTGVTIYKRGLKMYAEGNITDQDEVAANKLPWTAGETKVLLGTNPPNMYGEFSNKGNDETISGKWTFPGGGNANAPVSGTAYTTPTNPLEYPSKQYVDNSISGVVSNGVPFLSVIASAPNPNLEVTVLPGNYIVGGQIKHFSGGTVLIDPNETAYVYISYDGQVFWDQGPLEDYKMWSPLAIVTTDADSILSIEDIRAFTSFSYPDTNRSTQYVLGENVSGGEAMYLNYADGKIYKASASTSATADTFIGFALQYALEGDPYEDVIVTNGTFWLKPPATFGITAGPVYLADTPGVVSNTPGTYKKLIGYSASGSEIYIFPQATVADLSGTNTDTTTANLNDIMTQNVYSELLSSATAGETIAGATTPKAIYIEDGKYIPLLTDEQIESDNVYNVHGANWYGQTFIATKNKISDIFLDIDKEGTPTGNFVASIYAVDGSNNPTGAPLWSDAIVANSIGIANRGQYIRFLPNLSVTIGTTYAIVVNVVSGDGSNYIRWRRNSAGGYANGTSKTSSNSGSTWANGTGDMCFRIFSYDEHTIGRVYLSSSDDINKSKILGFAVTDANSGNVVNYVQSGSVLTYTGLTAGAKYFLSTNGNISTTVSALYIGQALSATQIVADQTIGKNYIVNSSTTSISIPASATSNEVIHVLSKIPANSLGTTGSLSIIGSYEFSRAGGSGNEYVRIYMGNTEIVSFSTFPDGVPVYYEITVYNVATSSQMIRGYTHNGTSFGFLESTKSIDTTNDLELKITLEGSTSAGGSMGIILGKTISFYNNES